MTTRGREVMADWVEEALRAIWAGVLPSLIFVGTCGRITNGTSENMAIYSMSGSMKSGGQGTYCAGTA